MLSMRNPVVNETLNVEALRYHCRLYQTLSYDWCQKDHKLIKGLERSIQFSPLQQFELFGLNFKEIAHNITCIVTLPSFSRHLSHLVYSYFYQRFKRKYIFIPIFCLKHYSDKNLNFFAFTKISFKGFLSRSAENDIFRFNPFVKWLNDSNYSTINVYGSPFQIRIQSSYAYSIYSKQSRFNEIYLALNQILKITFITIS